MKRKTLLALLNLAMALGPNFASAQTTAFTYQGKLTDDCCPATGYYDLTFKVFDNVGPGTTGQQGNTVDLTRVPVTNGLFTVYLNFDAPGSTVSEVFTGPRRWLQIDARTNNAQITPVTLLPRTELTPTPYALYAQKVGDGGVSATALAPSPADGKVLTYNSGSLQWTTPSGGLTLPYRASISADNQGVFELYNTHANGAGLYGSGLSYGIRGEHGGGRNRGDLGTPVSGVFGFSQTAAGVHGVTAAGSANSWQFGGVLGEAPASLANFEAVGVRGWNHSTGQSGYGVYGTHEGSGYGVFGICYREGRGMYGQANAAGGVGVYGLNAPTGNYGILGTANEGVYASSTTGDGVVGLSSVPNKNGVYGEHSGNGGGVAGRARGANGTGVYGVSELPSGRAGLFDGRVTVNGKVGVGTDNPEWSLDVWAQQSIGRFVSSSANFGSVVVLKNNTASPTYLGAINFEDGAGDTPGQIAYLANGDMVFRAAGAVKVPVLTITGGADLAEPFQMSEEKLPEGSVVVIDEGKPGQLKKSDRAYDTRVAGIISGANGIKPGIQLHQEGALEGGQNVALSGRVYALADASHSPIKPGDLLTTSATPGHCMKVTDPAQASGAIIGKAMSALAEGRGMVLVLVSLQ